MSHQSLTGHLLIAVPELIDPNFNQSVVLIIQHDRDGASGLVLNRATQTRVGDIFEDHDALPTADRPVYVGGPVDGPLMAIHGCVAHAEKDIVENVYFSMKRENLIDIIHQTFRPFRLFCGYSGWGPQQLDAELATGGWLVSPATADIVFADEESLWQRVCDQFGLGVIFSKQRPQVADPGAN